MMRKKSNRAVLLGLLALCAYGCASPGYPGAISTDRPDALYAPVTVPRGSFQYEAGLTTYTRDTTADVTNETLGFDILQRIGVAEGVEIRLGLPFQVGLDDASGTGLGDMSYGAKFFILEEDPYSFIPAVGLTHNIVVPPPGSDAASDSVALNFDLSAAYSDLFLGFGWGLNLGASAQIADIENRAFGYSLATAFYHSIISPYLSGYVQFQMRDADTNVADPLALSVGTGFALLLFDEMQLDIFGDFGLTDPAPDLVVGGGVSFRFDFLYY